MAARKRIDAYKDFCDIIRNNPTISALKYDALKTIGKPDRRSLEKSRKCKWAELLASAKEDKGCSTLADTDTVSRDYQENKAYVEVNTLFIHTLEEALAYAQVDLEQWKVSRWKLNSWTVTMKLKQGVGEPDVPETRTNYQVKVWLESQVPDVMDLAIRQLIKEIPKHKPPKRIQRKLPQTPYAQEMCLYDAHLGKLAWGAETEQGDYDIEIGTQLYVKSSEENLNFSAGFNISQIIFILGQDFMHAENFAHQTPLGKNILDVDSRLPKIYARSKMACLDAIKMCLQVAPVKVLWIPGNHDMHASFYLSEVIKEHFRNDKNVEVDNTPPWRKAILWGNLLVGYTHDANNRMANVVNMLPQFWPKLWGKSKYREWHTGHKHRKAEWKFMPTQTVGGVVIRQIPALSTIDAWHYQEGFVDAVPGGESFIWSKDNGVCAQFTAYVGGSEQVQTGLY